MNSQQIRFARLNATRGINSILKYVNQELTESSIDSIMNAMDIIYNYNKSRQQNREILVDLIVLECWGVI